MTIILSLIVAIILIALVLRSVLKTSQDSGYTSLGTLNSATTHKASIPPKPQPSTPSKSETAGISPQPNPTVSPRIETILIAELRRKLLLKAMGNEATVDRLIDLERKLNSSGTLILWLRAANERWEDDHEGRARR
jgi:hypothetical protein